MRRSILFAALLSTFVGAESADAEPPAKATPVAEVTPNLIPWPAKIALHTGSFTITGNTAIEADAAFAAEAAQLSAALSLQGGSGGGITLRKTDGLGAEGYTLEVGPQGI